MSEVQFLLVALGVISVTGLFLAWLIYRSPDEDSESEKDVDRSS